MLRPTFAAAVLVAGLIATVATADTGSGTDSGFDLTPLADLRVRQEVLDGVYHFDDGETDRNWIRMRSRLGARASWRDHVWEARLNNEHRHVLTPDIDLDWDEVIVDRLFWRVPLAADVTATVGRQDIVWPGGFLVLEGHPLDGSRSMFHDGVRLQVDMGWARLDIAAVSNAKRNKLVLIDDLDRSLADADESGVLIRAERGPWNWSTIVKDSDDPDSPRCLRTWTAGSRYDGRLGAFGDVEAELALQYQDGTVIDAIDGDDIDAMPDRATGEGWAWAAQAFLTRTVALDVEAEIGGFFYSGLDGDRRPFRAPWGSWPKWSELYIYTLVGENTPGRPHVAAWENIAAPRLTLSRPITERLSARAGVSWLLAPEPEWLSRGVLTQVGFDIRLPSGLAAHLVWERLHPGVFHDGRYGLPAFTDPVHFLRWQMTWSL